MTDVFRGIDAAASLKRVTPRRAELRVHVFRGIDAAASLKLAAGSDGLIEQL